MVPLNLPNILTLLRILAVPVVVVALLDGTPNGDTLAAIVFALAAMTDGLDGYIARSRDSITTFGSATFGGAWPVLWTVAKIAALYGTLHRLTPTPVVELNRAVAVAMADGPERGLEIVDSIAADHPTDPQLVAMARQYFKKFDNMAADPSTAA